MIAVLGATGMIYAYRAWRSGRLPLMVGEADAKYWGQRLPFLRVANLLGLTFFGVVFIVSAIFA